MCKNTIGKEKGTKNGLKKVIKETTTILAIMLVLTAFASATTASQKVCKDQQILGEKVPMWLAAVNAGSSDQPDQVVVAVGDLSDSNMYYAEKGKFTYITEIKKNLEVLSVAGDCAVIAISEVPTPTPTPTPEPIPEYKLINITSEPDGVISSIIKNNTSFGFFEMNGGNPLTVNLSYGDNLSLLLTKYGYVSEIVTLDYNTTAPLLNVVMKPESWRIMNFSEIGKIIQEETGYTLIYEGESYALDQNVSDGNRHTINESDMEITNRSDNRWELETSDGVSLFEKIENVSESQNIWYVTKEMNNKERISYSYGVFVSENGENVTVLEEANMTFGSFGSSGGVTMEGVNASGFFVSIKYQFINTTLVIMKSMETGRENFSRPLNNWLTSTKAPGLNLTLAESIGMLQFIPLEGTIVSASGKVLTKIPTYVSENPTVWNVVFFKLYQKSELTFTLAGEEAVAGKAIIMKKTSRTSNDYWKNILELIKPKEPAIEIIKEGKAITDDQVVVLLPYNDGKFWEWVGTQNAKRAIKISEEMKK